jgi:hypothetical protein
MGGEKGEQGLTKSSGGEYKVATDFGNRLHNTDFLHCKWDDDL